MPRTALLAVDRAVALGDGEESRSKARTQHAGGDRPVAVRVRANGCVLDR